MSSSLRRGMLAATAVVFSVASLAACGAGNDAQTLNMDPDNASLTKGDISVQNVNVVADSDSQGEAVVSARLFNQGDRDETLESITLPGKKVTVRLRSADGGDRVVVPAGDSLALSGQGNAAAEIADASGIRLGDSQPVVFTLSRTGKITLKATVVSTEHDGYQDVGPSAKATPQRPEDDSASTEPDSSPSATDGPSPSENPDEDREQSTDRNATPPATSQPPSADSSPGDADGAGADDAEADQGQ